MKLRNLKFGRRGASLSASTNRPGLLLARYWHALILLALVWCAHFWMSGSFGLYEDDFTYIPSSISASATALLRAVGEHVVGLGGHARPLQGAMIMLLSSAGWHAGGLGNIYAIAFAMVSLNVLLFYFLLRRLGDSLFATLGGIAFVLYPADTTHAYLTHALGLQPSLSFLLLGLHAFLSGRKIVAYVLVALTLLTYETAFTVFLVAPLLLVPWDRKMVKHLVKHMMVMAAILGSDLILRMVVGESRVTGLTLGEALWIPIRQMAVGPLVGFGAYFYKAGKVVLHLDLWLGLVAAGGTAGIALWLGGLVTRQASEDVVSGKSASSEALPREPHARFLRARGFKSSFRELAAHSLKMAAIGLLMLILAYPLTFTTNPIALVGRGTRVHFAGVVGAGMLWASLWELVLAIARSHRLVKPVRLALAILLGLTLSYDLSVQRDYARAWHLEKTFWREVLSSTRDINDGTVVLVGGADLPEPLQIGANTWAVPRILPEMYQFPVSWEAAPRVFRLTAEWKSAIVGSDSEFHLDSNVVFRPSVLTIDVTPTNTILLLRDPDGAVSRPRSVDIDGHAYALKPVGDPTLGSLPTMPLYHLLVDTGDNPAGGT